MKEKKTEVITVRIPPKTKAALEAEAQRREWTISKMAEKVLTLWAEQQEEPTNEPSPPRGRGLFASSAAGSLCEFGIRETPAPPAANQSLSRR